MRTFPAGALLPAVLAIVGVGIVVAWTNASVSHRLEPRLPGLDRAKQTVTASLAGPVAGQLARGPGAPSSVPGEWPWFRGRNFNALVSDGVALARQWPSGGPPALWSVELGEGYAGAAVRDGRVYVLDYDRDASADALRCLSLDDGREIWTYRYPVVVKRNHGMSRTVPAVDDRFVVSLGPKCHVVCLDRTSGELNWTKDLVRDFGAAVPQWYAGQCPLIDAGRLILAPGGDEALMVALDVASGDIVWKCPNPRGWKMTHSSITPAEIGGRKMYVYCGKGGVAGVAADDGTLLWDTTDWKISIATCPSPLALPDDRLFFCGGYNAGALLMEVAATAEGFEARTVRRFKPAEFGSTQHTPVLYEGHIYGVRETDKQLVCLDLEGNEVWASGSQHRFGLGPYLIADGLIYVLDDNGLLTMAEAIPDAYKPLAEAQVLEGHDAWGPMTLVAGRLIARDLTRMVCLNIAERLPTAADAPLAAADKASSTVAQGPDQTAMPADDAHPASPADPFAATQAPSEGEMPDDAEGPADPFATTEAPEEDEDVPMDPFATTQAPADDAEGPADPFATTEAPPDDSDVESMDEPADAADEKAEETEETIDPFATTVAPDEAGEAAEADEMGEEITDPFATTSSSSDAPDDAGSDDGSEP